MGSNPIKSANFNGEFMKVKYPRTFHLPWSLGITNDDKMLDTTEYFTDKRVIVTEKMDGENTTMYCDYIHARSLDSAHHESRNWVKAFHSSIAHSIPKSMRICGENVYAKHSIHYTNLVSYFYGFSIWEASKCLSWDETMFYFDELGITPVPVLYDGIYNESVIKKLDITDKEGYVIRVADSFDYATFNKNVAKFVRKDHVQTDQHWMHSEIIKNILT